MKLKRRPDHEGVIGFGPCALGISLGCAGHGTEVVDPRSDTLRTAIACAACTSKATRDYLDAGDPDPLTVRVIELDRIYGTGA
jgi:hypothetical protein